MSSLQFLDRTRTGNETIKGSITSSSTGMGRLLRMMLPFTGAAARGMLNFYYREAA